MTSVKMLELLQAKSGATLSSLVKAKQVEKRYLGGGKYEFKFIVPLESLQRVCEVCLIKFRPTRGCAKVCSKTCRLLATKARRDRYWEDKIKASKALAGQPGVLTCLECGFIIAGDLSAHITRHHKLTITTYYKKHDVGVESVVSRATRDKLSISSTGDRNVWYDHGGKFSPFSLKNIKATPDSIKLALVKSMQTAKINNTNATQLSYYTTRGMSEVEAIAARRERQITFSLEKCVAKHGEAEGLARWQARQEKWHKSFKKSNFSKISQELFHTLKDKISDVCIFATVNNIEGCNEEFILKTVVGSVYKLDFYVPATGKIIEFDGDYWHSVRQPNPVREACRDHEILESNRKFQILHIKEHDFKVAREQTIQRCLAFLTNESKL